MPDRASGMRDPKPCATLLLVYADGDEETIQVPKAVARSMRKKRSELAQDGLKRGELLSCLSDVQRSCAKERMISMLERRDSSKGEVLRRLKRDGYPIFAREHAIEVGERCGLLDDELFAERFARSKSAGGWGRRRIAFELDRRGIDVHAFNGWPDDFIDPGEEYEHAREIAARKSVSEPNARMKLARFLAGRGFELDLAYRVAEETLG